MSFQHYIAELFKNFLKDYLIFQDSVFVFDFVVYCLIGAQTLCIQFHVNLKIVVNREDNLQVYLLINKTLTTF